MGGVPDPVVVVSFEQLARTSAPATRKLPIIDAASLFMISPANNRLLGEAVIGTRDTLRIRRLGHGTLKQTPRFWARLPNYFLMSNMIHHNINSANLLAVVCLWLLSQVSRKAATLCSASQRRYTFCHTRHAGLMPKAALSPGARPLDGVGRAAVLRGLSPFGHAIVANNARDAQA